MHVAKTYLAFADQSAASLASTGISRLGLESVAAGVLGGAAGSLQRLSWLDGMALATPRVGASGAVQQLSSWSRWPQRTI